MAVSFFLFCFVGMEAGEKHWRSSHFREDGEHKIWFQGLSWNFSCSIVWIKHVGLGLGFEKQFGLIALLKEMMAFWSTFISWQGPGDWWLKISSTSVDVAIFVSFQPPRHLSNPWGSMYGIFTYIYHKNQPNVGKYTIHGSYGNGRSNQNSRHTEYIVIQIAHKKLEE